MILSQKIHFDRGMSSDAKGHPTGGPGASSKGATSRPMVNQKRPGARHAETGRRAVVEMAMFPKNGVANST